jgi:hypothetical protein
MKDERRKEEARLIELQLAEQSREALIRSGLVRILPPSERKVEEKEMRLLQQAELAFSRH